MPKRSSKRTPPEKPPPKESKAYRSLKALVEKRADQVFSDERESFNAADILGINVQPQESPTPAHEPKMTHHGPQKPTHGPLTASPGMASTDTGMVKTNPDTDKSEPGTAQTDPDMDESASGGDPTTKVVVFPDEIQTTRNVIPGADQAKPGVAFAEPGLDLNRNPERETLAMEAKKPGSQKTGEPEPPENRHLEVGDLRAEVRGGYSGPTPGFEEAMAGLHNYQGETSIDDRIQAVKIGAKMGAKFRAVLLYLNSIRNLQDPNVTVRVGYSRIAERSGVNGDYMRHKILPGLMMRGILSVVDKGLNGTIYRLEYPFSVISLIVGESEITEETLPLSMKVENGRSPTPPSEEATSLPPWVDREHWGTLNKMTADRLVDRAGSIERAQEILSILVYNETHGPEHLRVRNRLAVLTRYLQNKEMEIWPNDQGFETQAMQQAKQDAEEARRLKELAEQAIKDKQEAQLLTFKAALTEEQMAWIRSESKTRVSNQRGQHFLKDKFVLYKAEEEHLMTEWMERVQYGEAVPTLTGEED